MTSRPLPPRGDVVALTQALVALDSRNPSLVPDAAGEGECARALGSMLDAWGFRVSLHDTAPGRPNVVARIGRTGGRTLMFNGHLDTVGVAGMTHAPYEPEIRDGNLYGRGSCDMKGFIALAIDAFTPNECANDFAAAGYDAD